MVFVDAAGPTAKTVPVAGSPMSSLVSNLHVACAAVRMPLQQYSRGATVRALVVMQSGNPYSGQPVNTTAFVLSLAPERGAVGDPLPTKVTPLYGGKPTTLQWQGVTQLSAAPLSVVTSTPVLAGFLAVFNGNNGNDIVGSDQFFSVMLSADVPLAKTAVTSPQCGNYTNACFGPSFNGWFMDGSLSTNPALTGRHFMMLASPQISTGFQFSALEIMAPSPSSPYDVVMVQRNVTFVGDGAVADQNGPYSFMSSPGKRFVCSCATSLPSVTAVTTLCSHACRGRADDGHPVRVRSPC